MSLIQKEIADFSVQCYQNNAFHAVTKADVLGKWSVFFFYPADFTFVCPTELEDLANLYPPVPGHRLRDLRRLLRHPLRAQGLARRLGAHPEDPIPHAGRPHPRPVPRTSPSTSKPKGWPNGATFVVNPDGEGLWPMR